MSVPAIDSLITGVGRMIDEEDDRLRSIHLPLAGNLEVEGMGIPSFYLTDWRKL